MSDIRTSGTIYFRNFATTQIFLYVFIYILKKLCLKIFIYI